MEPLHPMFAALCVAAALASVAVWEKFRARPSASTSRITIDGLQGLRGYLAFFLFVYHASIWYFYLKTGNWTSPPSRFYTHLGQSSVVLVFMITGFLFFSRVLEQRSKVDWLRLYVSRVLRLAPLYVVMVAMLLAIVVTLAGRVVRTSIGDLMVSLTRWLFFTMFGAPNLNNVENTWVIVAGVAWALPYEIAFYACLPWLALVIGAKVPWPALTAVLVPLVWFVWFPIQPVVFPALAAGMVAALLARSQRVRRSVTGAPISICVLVLVVLVAAAFPSAYTLAPIALLGVAFAFVACGNNLFEILSGRMAQSLGDISYGLYLLHGIALFVLFRWGIGLPAAKNLTAGQFWLSVLALIPALVMAAQLSFEWFERPLWAWTDRLVARIQRRRSLELR